MIGSGGRDKSFDEGFDSVVDEMREEQLNFLNLKKYTMRKKSIYAS